MGLLGNVAEVASLRPRLMTQEFITVFSDLLNSCSDGIEVNLISSLCYNNNIYIPTIRVTIHSKITLFQNLEYFKIFNISKSGVF